MTNPMQEALQIFTLESRELLDDMEAALLAGDISAEGINAVFRAAHTIKGSAGLFGLEHIVAFTHVVEGVLDRARDGQVGFDAELTSLMLACGDHIRLMIDAVHAGRMEEDPELVAFGAPLLHSLGRYLPAQGAGTPAAVPPPADRAGGIWHISLRFGPEVLRNGMDPMSFLRYLGTMGRLVRVATVDAAVPALAGIDPESCYLGFEIAFDSAADRAAIEGAFDFVRDDCEVRIIAPGSDPAEYAQLAADHPAEAALLGELFALGAATDARDPVPATSAALPAALPAVPEAPAESRAAVQPRRQAESASVRVDANKLDHLINLVGELIVATASASVIGRRANNVELQECVSNLSGLVEDLRDSALQLRMVKIGATFNRFQRVVHDVARDLGKEIDLVISGEDTELDKTVVEKIADPLTHLVRNAIDHGIEPAALRAERGKRQAGTIRLNAYHDAGTIVIEVSDDGGGLKRDCILAKALERGLVEPGKALSDDEIFALIFEPGFSTAEQVTNLSGRGVGMDVVKRNIMALRGSIGVASAAGAGTTVTVRLPLTLAIIDGFQVAVGHSQFVLPLDMVEECVEFDPVDGHDYANLRGKVLPFVRLGDLFRIRERSGSRKSLVVVKYAGQRAGLVVDGLLGESQTVIKPLGKVFQHLRCVTGSSILGSGEIALILDVPALIRHATGTEPTRLNQPHEAAAA